MRRIFLIPFLIILCAQAGRGFHQEHGSPPPSDYAASLPLALARPATPSPTPTITPTPTSTPSPTITPAPTTTPTPTPVAEILSYSIFRPSAGSSSIYVAGEVRNNSASPLRYVRARFTFYDAEGAIVNSNSALTTIASLPPGMRSPFQVTLSNFREPWATIEPYLSWEQAPSGPYLLDITENSSYYGSGGVFHVCGRACNNTPGTRTYVEAVVTAYDQSGRVVGIGHAPTEPRMVEPGQLTFFDVAVSYYDGKPWTVITSHAVLVVDD